MAAKRVEIRAFGQVQGVFFRQGVKQKAEELGLAGWVENEDDGSVRIVAEGQERQLQKLAEWVKLGTEWAKVEKVEIEWREARNEFIGFRIL